MRRKYGTRLVGLLLCVALLVSIAAAPTAAQTDAAKEFHVALDAEGNADVAVTYTFDLETDSEKTAFDELRTNETARDAMATRFKNRLQAVAASASNKTGRDMAVTGASVDVNSTDSVGLVTLTVQWENLASVDDSGRMTVTEPFASGFEPNRTFTVSVPENYEITSATPEPDSTADGSASWAAGTSLSGFELVAEPTEEGTGGDGAGFGVVVSVGALLGALLLARRDR